MSSVFATLVPFSLSIVNSSSNDDKNTHLCNEVKLPFFELTLQ